ncbi:hypothetical protein [Arcicella rosea]|uniref:Uncharacterized protein n=1 Tax=Arcicella rosea TaxID=502909 RepID=A0A841ER27_9BACT|nr:hypothetical protein [Arcicella rosea]MBB6003829.1 hypothetical protein [Arcicella rosea]
MELDNSWNNVTKDLVVVELGTLVDSTNKFQKQLPPVMFNE